MKSESAGAGVTLGYCTNVHAGADLARTLANLERHALAVKARVSPEGPMGVGLWLSARAGRELLEQERVAELRDWLAERGLVAFTFNGFPHGDFHEPVVKYRVYDPNWSDQERLRYTLDLITILSELTEEGGEAGISTLPVGWRKAILATPDAPEAASRNLGKVAEHLARVESETGRLIHVDLEPEPGCYLDTSSDLVEFFEHHVFQHCHEDHARRHLRVCHDICHAAVMFEGQAECLKRYREAGIAVGKIQVSSAVLVDFTNLAASERAAALDQLRGFAEDRYLHQTVVRESRDGSSGVMFYDDLPELLATSRSENVAGQQWRIHFHVPLYLERFGLLGATQKEILDCLQAAREFSDVRHFEAETYAWGVLPPELRVDDLAEGIARELIWLRDRAATLAAA
jgi:hypothetical protein